VVIKIREQISREGTVYEVPRNVALMSGLVRETLGDDDDDADTTDPNMPDIPLPNVSADVLEKVIEYCRYYQDDEMRTIQTPLNSNKLEELVQEWYADFVKIDKNQLFDLVAAANFMDVKPLLDLTCLAVSILIKGKSASELRQMFNISNEFSSEERAQIERNNNRALEESAPSTLDSKDATTPATNDSNITEDSH
jgi:S-phase kinase-associated protein 1